MVRKRIERRNNGRVKGPRADWGQSLTRHPRDRPGSGICPSPERLRNVLRRLSHFLGTPPKSEGKVAGTSSRLPVFTGLVFQR